MKNITSISKKRAFSDAFGVGTFDDERYNGHIEDDYFIKGGVGHGVYNLPAEKIEKSNDSVQQKPLKS